MLARLLDATVDRGDVLASMEGGEALMRAAAEALRPDEARLQRHIDDVLSHHYSHPGAGGAVAVVAGV